jgi:hypothetical protein
MDKRRQPINKEGNRFRDYTMRLGGAIAVLAMTACGLDTDGTPGTTNIPETTTTSVTAVETAKTVGSDSYEQVKLVWQDTVRPEIMDGINNCMTPNGWTLEAVDNTATERTDDFYIYGYNTKDDKYDPQFYPFHDVVVTVNGNISRNYSHPKSNLGGNAFGKEYVTSIDRECYYNYELTDVK